MITSYNGTPLTKKEGHIMKHFHSLGDTFTAYDVSSIVPELTGREAAQVMTGFPEEIVTHTTEKNAQGFTINVYHKVKPKPDSERDSK